MCPSGGFPPPLTQRRPQQGGPGLNRRDGLWAARKAQVLLTFIWRGGPWKQPEAEGLFLLTLKIIFHEKIRTGMKEGLQKSVGSCTLNILSKERSNLFPRPVPYFFPKFPI